MKSKEFQSLVDQLSALTAAQCETLAAALQSKDPANDVIAMIEARFAAVGCANISPTTASHTRCLSACPQRSAGGDLTIAVWNNDQIVEEAKGRNKVWNEVNRADRISEDRECDGFGMPRRSRVAPGDVKSNNVPLDRSRPLFQPSIMVSVY